MCFGCSAQAFSKVDKIKLLDGKWANKIYRRKKEGELLARCI